MCYTLISRIREPPVDMIVIEVIGEHILDGCPAIVTMDNNELEGYSHKINNVVDKPSCLAARHPVYVSDDSSFTNLSFLHRDPIQLFMGKHHL